MWFDAKLPNGYFFFLLYSAKKSHDPAKATIRHYNTTPAQRGNISSNMLYIAKNALDSVKMPCSVTGKSNYSVFLS